MSLSRFDFDDLWRLRLDAFGGACGGGAGEGDAPAWELVDDGARGDGARGGGARDAAEERRPCARHMHSMVGSGGRLWVFGGMGGGECGGADSLFALGDVWSFDPAAPAGRGWRRHVSHAEGVAAAAAAADDARGGAHRFGGSDSLCFDLSL